MKQYEWLKGLKKFVWVFLVVFSTALAGMQQAGYDLKGPDDLTGPALGAAVLALIKLGLNYVKTKGMVSGSFAKLLPVLIVVTVLAGCASTNMGEKIIERDASGNITTSDDFHYRATTLCLPGMKVGEANQTFAYKWGGDENTIGTGQNAKDVDATGTADLIGQVVSSMIEAYIKTHPVPITGADLVHDAIPLISPLLTPTK